MTSWSRWVHWANLNCDCILMDGQPAVIMGAQRYTRKMKIVFRGRHETVLVEDIALVCEPGEFEAQWLRPEPWPNETRPEWAEKQKIAAPTLVVEHDPTALHPSFLPAADRATKELDVLSLRRPRIELDSDLDFQ